MGCIRAHRQSRRPRVKQRIAIYHTLLLKDQNFKHNLEGRRGFTLLSRISVAKMTSFLGSYHTMLLGFKDLIFLFLSLALSHVPPSRTHLVAGFQANTTVINTEA